jgi:Zn-dependent protease
MQFFLSASAWILPIMMAVILHEVAHGWVASRFGDDTAKRMGRLTLNPISHIDRVGTIVMPMLLVFMKSPIIFGYAKPVPVDFNRLSPLRFATICVALAGPFTNLLLAILAGLLLHVDYLMAPEQAPWIFQNIMNLLIINCVIMVFNLIPILPLDGGRVLVALFSKKPQDFFVKWDRLGMILVLSALFLPSLIGYNITSIIIGTPAFWAFEQVLWITGNAR